MADTSDTIEFRSISASDKGSRGHFELSASMYLPRKREEIFPFFSNARNLDRITPPFLNFRVVTEGEIEIKAGTLIDYQLRVHGLPIKWRSRITVFEPPVRFVDEEVKGPYTLWYHEHFFDEAPDGVGTICRDRVQYRVLGGALIHALFVKRDLMRIFSFRQKCLREMFG